jgi:tetratricopeptide (TPR) repeat protein
MLRGLLKGLWRRPPANDLRESGKRLFEAGDLKRATELLESAVRRAPHDAEARFFAGVARYRLGDFNEALAHLERCVVMAPSSPDTYCYAGAVHHALGHAEIARRHCASALERDPAHVEANRLLAALDLPGPAYTEVLAALHERLRPRAYVEIGVAGGRSLAAVQPTTRVVGIDPAPRLTEPPGPNVQIFAMKSDDYFASRDLQADLGGLPIDLAFIDGSHLFEQTMRDFIHVERCATHASTVLLHDAYPLNRLTAERESKTGFWSGDVWRLVLILKKYRPDLTIANVAAAPTGLCVVRGLDPASRVLADNHDAIVEEFMAVDYDVLERGDKAALLNLFPNDAQRILDLVTREPRLITPA